jgi:hypothetical protein
VVSSPTALSTVRAQALARRDQGDLNGARNLMEQALDRAAMSSGEDHPEVLLTAQLLASLHRQAGDLSGARRVLENAHHAGAHRHGEEHPLLLAISFDLGELADELGNRHEARKHFSKVAGLGVAAGFDQQKVRAAQAWLGPVNTPPATRPAVVTPVYQPVTPTVAPGPPPPPAPPPNPPAREIPAQGYRQPDPQPSHQEPTRQQPAHQELAYRESVDLPVDRQQPVYQQPAYQQPAHQQPTYQEPAYQEPAYQEPAYQPAVSRPPVAYVAPTPARLERPSMTVPPPTVFTPIPAPPVPARRNTAMLVMTIMSALVAVVAATVTVYLLVRPAGGPGAEIIDRGPATGLSIVSATGGEVTLRWTDPSEGEASQFIYYSRKDDKESGVTRQINNGVTQYTQLGLNANWVYCFKVLTFYSSQSPQASEEVCTNQAG